MNVSELRTSLLMDHKNAYQDLTAAQREEMESYCKRYAAFMDTCKTEREATAWATAQAEAHGFKPAVPGMDVKPGDKIYLNNRGKSFLIAVVGSESLAKGANICAAHVDSPRMDLKPNPLYEDSEIAFFKTHYYGGIKKYQWAVTPLALHGRVMLRDGRAIDLDLGEKPGDPVFVVSDLLPHLAQEQVKRTLADGIKGEELNVLLGSTPIADPEVKQAFKLKVLSILNEMYGITEADFLRAELTMVPAQHAVDIGFDRSMVGAYGQDDKVCAYTALMAEIETKKPEYTTVTALVDKEEIGSVGNTGMSGDMLLHYMEDLAEAEGERVRDVLRASLCLSADVNAAFDPTFPDAFEANNASYMNRGPVLTKYTGSRGKSGSNDASAETMQRVIKYMDDENVMWQIGELGRVDLGGGGTVAMFIANMDVDTVDLGVPVLAMHAPFEITSKLDVYYTYKAFKAFNK